MVFQAFDISRVGLTRAFCTLTENLKKVPYFPYELLYIKPRLCRAKGHLYLPMSDERSKSSSASSSLP